MRTRTINDLASFRLAETLLERFEVDQVGDLSVRHAEGFLAPREQRGFGSMWLPDLKGEAPVSFCGRRALLAPGDGQGTAWGHALRPSLGQPSVSSSGSTSSWSGS